MRWLLKRSPKDDSIVANYWTRLRRGGSEVFRCCIVQFIAKIAKNCILILTSIFVFIPPSSERFIELSIWMSAPSLSSPSASGGKQLLQTQQTSTRPPNRLWAAIKYLLEHYVWLQSHYGTWTKGWGDKCRNKYLLSSKGIGLFVFTFTETLFPRNCSCSQSPANIAQASVPLGNILG